TPRPWRSGWSTSWRERVRTRAPPVTGISVSSPCDVEPGHEGARRTLVPGDEDAFGRRRVDVDIRLVSAGSVVPGPVDIPRPIEPERDRVVGTGGRQHASGHG